MDTISANRKNNRAEHTDGVVDDVEFLGEFFEVLLGVVDRQVSPQALQKVQFTRAGGRSDSRGAVDVLRQLNFEWGRRRRRRG